MEIVVCRKCGMAVGRCKCDFKDQNGKFQRHQAYNGSWLSNSPIKIGEI